MVEGGAVWAVGVLVAGGVRSLPLTPHLTSPLEGGRDEIGEGVGVGAGLARCSRRLPRGFLPAQE